MISKYNKYKKSILITASLILFFALVFILFISSLAKHLIERYDVEYTGRQIKTGLVYVNPFTGTVLISHLKIYEFNDLITIGESDSVFFSAKKVRANFALLKLFSKTVEITDLVLNEPSGVIIQSNKVFNFSDLILKFTPKKINKSKLRIHFNILRIKIKNGTFFYRENLIPVDYYIKEVYFESTGKHWDSDTVSAKFSFSPGIGKGRLKGNFTINLKTLDYRFAAIAHEFDLDFLGQYLKDLTNYGDFRANFDADIKATGNLKDQENIDIKGMVAINDFHFGENPDDDYASFDKLIFVIEDLSPKNHQYLFDSLILNNPFFKYERYDYLDNIQMLFGKKGTNISAAKANTNKYNLILKIAEYIKVLAKNFFKSDYKINKLAISDGRFEFNDYSLNEKFSIEANPFYLNADSFNRNNKWVNLSFKSEIIPFGSITINLDVNPKDSGDFDLQYSINTLPVSMFNAYMITYTSYPLDRGTIEVKGTWNVRQGIINSKNHILIIDPRVAERVNYKDTKWVPSPLIMFLIREHGNFIDYEIPISGNLKNPKFHLSDVLLDILENIFTMPAEIPYIIQVKKIEDDIEKSLSLKWEMQQRKLLSNQEKFIETMVDFLVKNPDESISVYPIQYAEKEKEYILFFEAKKKYYLITENIGLLLFSEEDSIKVDRMSIKDSLFIRYLGQEITDTMLFTIQDICASYIDTTIVYAKFEQLNKVREAAFLSYFVAKSVDDRVKINPVYNTTPYNGFSFYKIVYKDEFPEPLIKAYKRMNKINNTAPRKIYETSM